MRTAAAVQAAGAVPGNPVMDKEETLRTLNQLSGLLLNFSAFPDTLTELTEKHQSAMLCLMSELCLKVEDALTAQLEASDA
jgi:hypothetical protein